jgi:hypothetical protein
MVFVLINTLKGCIVNLRYAQFVSIANKNEQKSFPYQFPWKEKTSSSNNGGRVVSGVPISSEQLHCRRIWGHKSKIQQALAVRGGNNVRIKHMLQLFTQWHVVKYDTLDANTNFHFLIIKGHERKTRKSGKHIGLIENLARGDALQKDQSNHL